MRHRVSYLMGEIWERAVETALDGQTDHAAARSLTLDGAVKCLQGRLPPPGLLEKFQNLQHLSIANIGVSSLEQFPRLRNLQKLILSDNRIAGGLEFLVEAGLESLRDLDLSNNRIQYIEDLAPLAQLKLVSLDLYECPVTRVKDYRSRVLGLIKSLKYLDKMDADGNERPESDDEDEDEEEDEDDPGSGEIDGEDRPYRMNNGRSEVIEGVVDVDEDEESDADEEETETVRQGNGPSHHANGFRVEAVNGEDDEEGDDDEENESGEEIDEDEGEEDDVVEVHEIGDSDDEEDGVEDDDDDDDDDEDDDDDDDDDEEEVDNEEVEFAEPESTGRLTSTEGEIDGHEQGEDDGEDDDNGETGEEEQVVEDDGEFEDGEEGEEEDEDCGAGYLVQPVGQVEEHDAGGSDMDPGNEEDDAEEEEEVDDDEVQVLPPSSSQLKRKRGDDADEDEDDDGDDDDGDPFDDDAYNKSQKKHR